jgi:hypothetical protein
MAIRRRRNHRLRADVAACAGPVLHDDALAELLLERGLDEPRHGVGEAPGRVRDHQPERLGGKVLGGNRPAQEKQEG